MAGVARKYVDYPKFMGPGQAMNAGASELPLLLLTVFYGPGVAGFYSIAHRVMTAPLSLVADAIGDVYRQSAAEQYVAWGECLGIFIFSFKRLFAHAVLPMVPMLMYGPAIYAFMSGENWRAAGEIATVASALMFFQTVSLPLSNAVLPRGWFLLESVWQLLRVLFVVGVFLYLLCHRVRLYGGDCGIRKCVSVFFMAHSFLQYGAAHGEMHLETGAV